MVLCLIFPCVAKFLTWNSDCWVSSGQSRNEELACPAEEQLEGNSSVSVQPFNTRP